MYDGLYQIPTLVVNFSEGSSLAGICPILRNFVGVTSYDVKLRHSTTEALPGQLVILLQLDKNMNRAGRVLKFSVATRADLMTAQTYSTATTWTCQQAAKAASLPELTRSYLCRMIF